MPPEDVIPMPGRILVRPDDLPNTLGRLTLPDSARRFARKGLQGTVYAVGEDCKIDLRPGDRVLYCWYGYDLKNCRLPDELSDLVVLKPESVLARLVNYIQVDDCLICGDELLGGPEGVCLTCGPELGEAGA